jgi:hypothetical protein
VRLLALRAGRPLSLRKIPGTHFCYRLSRTQGHSAAWRIMSIEKFNDLIANRTRDLPACSTAPTIDCDPTFVLEETRVKCFLRCFILHFQKLITDINGIIYDSVIEAPLYLIQSCLSIYLSIYGSTALFWTLDAFWDFWSFTQSVGILRRRISPSQGRYLHTGQHKHRINAHRHPYLKWDSKPGYQRSSGRRHFMP